MKSALHTSVQHQDRSIVPCPNPPTVSASPREIRQRCVGDEVLLMVRLRQLEPRSQGLVPSVITLARQAIGRVHS